MTDLRRTMLYGLLMSVAGQALAQELYIYPAKGQSAEQQDLYRRAADLYLGLWREFGEKRIDAGQKPSYPKMDEVLHNLARTYQAAHLLGKAMQVRHLLLQEKNGMHETELGKLALYDLARNYQSIAVYDRAAEYYERYARATHFRGEHADVALSDAVVLRLGLGQEDQALRTAQTFNQHLGAKHPAQSAQIAFAVAAHHAERGDHAAVRKALGSSLRLIDRSGDFDIQVQAHALLGRAYAELGRGGQAAQEYGRVRKLWADPAAAEARFESLEPDPRVRQRRIGRALDAVGEALFFFAERDREAVARVRFPEYRGPGTRAAVSDHIARKVAAWIKAKRPLIERATAAYRRIVDLRPAPPPRWVIAAGARVGTMWGTFVQEFRDAPIPDSIRNDAELRTAYYHEIDRASEPQKRVARDAFETCLGYSVTYQYFDEHSRSCERWLADTYKSEYHLLDEFHGRPNRGNAARLEHAPALTIGGEVVRG